MINKLVCGELGEERRRGGFREIVEIVVTICRNQEKCDCANANVAESRAVMVDVQPFRADRSALLCTYIYTSPGSVGSFCSRLMSCENGSDALSCASSRKASK